MAPAQRGGVLGRALVSLVEANLDDECASIGCDGASPHGASPSSGMTDETARVRSQLKLWRDALCHQYGLPPEGASLRACWTSTLRRACTQDAATRRLPDEPDAFSEVVQVGSHVVAREGTFGRFTSGMLLEQTKGAPTRQGSARSTIVLGDRIQEAKRIAARPSSQAPQLCLVSHC